MKTLAKYDRISWFSIMVGAFVGGVASILQAIERMNWAAQPAAPLACDLNNAFSCSNVFGAWQSSVFGFSNSILCLVFFALMFGFGLAAYFSEQTNKIVRLVMHFFRTIFSRIWCMVFTANCFCCRFAMCILHRMLCRSYSDKLGLVTD